MISFASKTTRLQLSRSEARYNYVVDLLEEIQKDIVKEQSEIDKVEIRIKEAVEKVDSCKEGSDTEYLMCKIAKCREIKQIIIDTKNILIRQENKLIDEKNALRVAIPDLWEEFNFSMTGLDPAEQFRLPTNIGDTWKLMDVGVSTDERSPEEVALYARNDTMELLKFLSKEWEEFSENDKDRVAFVNGPEGVGKSCIILSWAMNMAASGKAEVLWIRKLRGAYYFNKDIQNGVFRKETLPDDPLLLVKAYRERSPDNNVIIFDGFIKEDKLNDLVLWSCSYRSSKTLLLACAAYDKGYHNYDMTCMLRYPNSFIADSWSIEEIREANRLLNWNKDVDMQYYYSGGSVRHFVGTIDRAKEQIDVSLSLLEHHHLPLLLDGQLRDASFSSVNSLQYLRKHKEELIDPFVSLYAGARIMAVSNLKFVKDATIRLDRRFKRHVFPFMRNYPLSQWLNNAGNIADWPKCPNSAIGLWSPKYIEDLHIDSTVQWIYPENPFYEPFGEQPCFEALYVDPNIGRVDVVQITLQIAYRYRMDVLVPWLAAIRDKWGMEAINLRLIQLSPEGKADKVTFNKEQFKNVDKLPEYVNFSVDNNHCFALSVYEELK